MRRAIPADHAEIRRVVRAAFNASRFDEAQMVEAARAEGVVLVELVEEREERIVGHIMFSRMICDPPRFVAGLAPVGVEPAFQHQKIGDALCRAGIEAVRAMGAEAVVLLGHPTYYPRFGFSPALTAPLVSRYAGQEAFMGLELAQGGLRPPLKIDFPAAFE